MSACKGVRWRTLTPGTQAGAIGMVWLGAEDDAGLARAFAMMGMRGVGRGEVALREVMGIDEALVACVDDRHALVMPHGSVAGMRAIARRLTELFGEAADEDALMREAGAHFAEARSEVEARAMAALTRAHSPLAVEALLRQHELWKHSDKHDAARDRVMGHLLTPALVVAVGASNIGKSTLINALAKRHVSVVADEPGTTRDHVGVLLDCGGLVVQYVDTPGVRETSDREEIAARTRAMELARRADVLVLCGDAEHEPVEVEGRGVVVRAALRADRGRPAWKADVVLCARSGSGLETLVEVIRERLVPRAVLEAGVPWKFWA